MSELPRGWVKTTLGELGSWQGGGTPDKSNAAYWTGGNIPWVSPKDMKRFHISEAEDQITEAALAGSSANLVAENSVLLVTRSGILKHTLPVALTGRNVAINQDIKALTPHPGLDPLFIAQQIKSLGSFVLKNCTKAGTTVDSVDFERLKAVSTNIPPLAEQKRIVAKLAALNAKSARVRTELARIETLVSRYKQAVLSKAFSGHGLGIDVQDKLHLSEVVALRTGPFGSALHKSDYITGGVPLVNPMHILKGKIEVDPKTSVTVAKAEQLEEFRLKSGDVVLARRGEMGRAAVVGEAESGYLCGTGSMIVRPSPKLSPIYLQRYLSSPAVVMALESAAVGTTMVNLNQSILLSQTIPLPSIEEQHEIVRRIESAFAKIDRLAKEAKRALELVGRLDEAILAKAFCGELVPQDESDEPAEHLLARIRAEREAAPKGKRGRGAKG